MKTTAIHMETSVNTMMRNEWGVLSSHIFFRVPFTCLASWLKVSLSAIIPDIATFVVPVLMFLVRIFAMVCGSSLDGKLLVPQWNIICFGAFVFHTLCFGSTNDQTTRWCLFSANDEHGVYC